jgi:hypothetical protein
MKTSQRQVDDCSQASTKKRKIDIRSLLDDPSTFDAWSQYKSSEGSNEDVNSVDVIEKQYLSEEEALVLWKQSELFSFRGPMTLMFPLDILIDVTSIYQYLIRAQILLSL